MQAITPTILPSDAVTLALYALYGSLFTSVCGVLLAVINNFGQRRAERKADDVAVKAEEVKNTLADKAIVTDAKLDSIHILVNSDMGKEKKAKMDLAKENYDLSPTQDRLERYEQFKADYEKHMASQKVVDASKAETRREE